MKENVHRGAHPLTGLMQGRIHGGR